MSGVTGAGAAVRASLAVFGSLSAFASSRLTCHICAVESVLSNHGIPVMRIPPETFQWGFSGSIVGHSLALHQLGRLGKHSLSDRRLRLSRQAMTDRAVIFVDLRPGHITGLIRGDRCGLRHLLIHPRMLRHLRQRRFKRHRWSRGGHRRTSRREIEKDTCWNRDQSQDQTTEKLAHARSRPQLLLDIDTIPNVQNTRIAALSFGVSGPDTSDFSYGVNKTSLLQGSNSPVTFS